jgi:nitrate reductase gamma subunit
MEALAYWAQHIVTFRAGAATFIHGMPLIYQLHIFIGLTIILVFPFTRLVHIWSFPILYLKRVGYQLVRRN